MLPITPIKDIDNMIFEYIRNIQEINIDKINEDIQHMAIDERRMFGFKERIIYYDKTKFGKYVKLQKMIMPCCCIKCGNYMKRFDANINKKILCECNREFNHWK